MPTNIIRLTDRELYEAFRDFLQDLEGAELPTQKSTFHVALKVGNIAPSLAKSTAKELHGNAGFQALLGMDTYAVQTLRVEILPLKASVIVTRKDESLLDDLDLKFNDTQSPDESTKIRILAALSKVFSASGPIASSAELVGQTASDLLQAREQTVHRLEVLYEKVLRENLELRKSLEEDFHERQVQLDGEHAARMEELLLQNAEKEGAFQKREAELDDRSARHARREQFRTATERILKQSDEFHVTTATARKRWPIHATFVVTILGLLLYAGSQIPSYGKDLTLYQQLRLAATIIGTVGFVIYYLRFNMDWFTQHFDEELRLQRTALDLERAGWVVDLSIEAREGERVLISDELLERLATNLFGSRAVSDLPRHPSEDLQALLFDHAAEIDFPLPNGGRARFGPRNLKNLRKNSDRSSLSTEELG